MKSTGCTFNGVTRFSFWAGTWRNGRHSPHHSPYHGFRSTSRHPMRCRNYGNGQLKAQQPGTHSTSATSAPNRAPGTHAPHQQPASSHSTSAFALASGHTPSKAACRPLSIPHHQLVCHGSGFVQHYALVCEPRQPLPEGVNFLRVHRGGVRPAMAVEVWRWGRVVGHICFAR